MPLIPAEAMYGRSGVQDQLLLHRKFKANLSYVGWGELLISKDKKEIYYSHPKSSKSQPYYRNTTLGRLLPFNHATTAKGQPKMQLSHGDHSGRGVPKVQAQVYRKQSPPVMIPLTFMSTSDTLMEEDCLYTHKGKPQNTKQNLTKAQSTGLAWPFSSSWKREGLYSWVSFLAFA